MDRHVHLGGHDAGECGLAQARRPGKQQVIGGATPTPSCLKDDTEMLFEFRLTNELIQSAGPQACLVVFLDR